MKQKKLFPGAKPGFFQGYAQFLKFPSYIGFEDFDETFKIFDSLLRKVVIT